MQACLYVCTYVCMCVYVMCVQLNLCKYANCMYVCACVYVCVRSCVHKHMRVMVCVYEYLNDRALSLSTSLSLSLFISLFLPLSLAVSISPFFSCLSLSFSLCIFHSLSLSHMCVFVCV